MQQHIPFFGSQRSSYGLSNGNGIQTKLTIGQPGDVYEKEADAMADKVVQRLSESKTDVTNKNGNSVQAKPIAPLSTITPFVQTKCASCEQEEKLQKMEEENEPDLLKGKLQKKPIFESNAEPPDDEKNIQRKCAACEKEEKLQKKDEKKEDKKNILNGKLQKKPIFESNADAPDEEKNIQRKCAECEQEDEKKLQTKSENNSPQNASTSIENSLSSSKGSGSPLPAATRGQMENSLGADFSGVRIHNDSSSGQMNKDLHAQAFTYGSDIYFNSGKYDANSNSGKHLLAHELTHVVQQGDNSSLIQRRVFGDEITFDSLPGIPYKARVSGPYSDPAISQALYGNAGHEIIHDTSDYTIIIIDFSLLLERWKPFFNSADTTHSDQFGLTDEELVNVGLFALGNVLRTNAADSVGFLRTLYNNGVAEIVSQRANMIRGMLPAESAERIIADLGNNLERSEMVSILQRELSSTQAETIARTVSEMRHDLALNTRKAGGMVLERGAELIDGVRGQTRPTYEALRAAGRSDAEIIISATKTNHFVNRLPRGMRIAGGVLLVASAGFSIYLIISADPADRARVAREEAGGFAGGLIGAEAATAICIGVGIATGGFALIVCGIIGGTVGGAIGRDPYGFLQIMDIAPHHSSSQEGRMYRLQGVLEEIDLFILSIPQTTVSESQHALVIATGMVSGELIGGRGHYRKYQVIPANQSSINILGRTEPQYVPDYALVQYSAEDLQHE